MDANAIVLAKGGSGWENYSVESTPGNILKITGSDDRGGAAGRGVGAGREDPCPRHG